MVSAKLEADGQPCACRSLESRFELAFNLSTIYFMLPIRQAEVLALFIPGARVALVRVSKVSKLIGKISIYFTNIRAGLA